MAVEAYKSDQLQDDVRLRPTSDHGKLRFQYFSFTNTVEGDANSTIDLCNLPSGTVRVLPGLSRITTSAMGAARTLDIGHRAYVTSAENKTEQAEDEDAFVAALDVSAGVAGVAFSTDIKDDLYSAYGITLFAKVEGGTVPVDATVEGYVAYLYE